MPRQLGKAKRRQAGALSTFDKARALEAIAASDRQMARLIKKVGPFALELEPIESPFHALAESICYQQLTGKAAQTIFGRLLDLFERPKFLRAEDILRVPDEKLRAVGLSGSKVLSIKDLALKAVDGVVPTAKQLEKMDDDEIVERLTQIRGIGPWSVEMMLIFRMGRPDVLPINDYGVQKGFAKTYKLADLPKPKELSAHGERWRPYRTVASWYLWRALEI